MLRTYWDNEKTYLSKFKNGWYLASQDLAWSYNFETEDWFLPLGVRIGKVVKFLKLPALILQGLWLGLLVILGVGLHERRAWQLWRFLLWSRCTLGVRVRQRRRGEHKTQDHGEDEEFVMHPL